MPMGVVSQSALAPASTSTRMISSVAYATEESASDESTARPVTLESLSRCASREGSCRPISARLIAPRVASSDTVEDTSYYLDVEMASACAESHKDAVKAPKGAP